MTMTKVGVVKAYLSKVIGLLDLSLTDFNRSLSSINSILIGDSL